MGSTDFAQLKMKFLSELVGTFAISFFASAAIVLGFLVPGLDATGRLVFAALVPGCTLALDITFLARYSGSHVNPAITVTFASAGSFKRGLVVPYFAFQLLGGLLAGLTLFLVFDSVVQSASLGSNKLGTGVGPVEGIALEVIGTMLLCLVVLYAVAFIKGSGKQGIVAGAALFVLIMILGPISGGSLNPVRSLGPAIFSGYLDGQYVYVIGPIVGAAIAGVVFRAERGRRASEQNR